MYVENGHIQQAFVAARLLLEGLDPDESLPQPPPIVARALYKLIANFGLQTVRKEGTSEKETLHQVIHTTLHDAVRQQCIGFDR
mmetsp:Transcript_33579/g.85974  ORF Transcript_33579/g.85974 Transcript_33579/m.85974 type:complete len:84 (+) Transcript_33579:1310-1561(+)